MHFLQLILHLVHVFAVISWLGAMYFNLVLIFPGYRQAATDIQQEKRLYQVQGTRAGRLLYAFIFFTFASGVGLALLAPQASSFYSVDSLIKLTLLIIMVGCHLTGSYYYWPRIMFSTGSEVKSLLFGYKVTMLISAALGSLVVVLTYFWKLDTIF